MCFDPPPVTLSCAKDFLAAGRIRYRHDADGPRGRLLVSAGDLEGAVARRGGTFDGEGMRKGVLFNACLVVSGLCAMSVVPRVLALVTGQG